MAEFNEMMGIGQEQKFEWINESIGQKNGNFLYEGYRWISKKMEFHIGDFVHLLPADPKMEYFIAKIGELFEDKSHNKMLSLRWCFRPSDLSHDPPLLPEISEVYLTNYIDIQTLDSVIERCEVYPKAVYDEKKFPKVSSSLSKYFYKYLYSSETGEFLPILRDNEDSRSGEEIKLSKIECREAKSRSSSPSTKEISNLLLTLESTRPSNIISSAWKNLRLNWISRAKSASTIKELVKVLLDLVDGFQIRYPYETPILESERIAWRKIVQGIHSYDALKRHVLHYKNEVARIKLAWIGYDVQNSNGNNPSVAKVFTTNIKPFKSHKKHSESIHEKSKSSELNTVDDILPANNGKKTFRNEKERSVVSEGKANEGNSNCFHSQFIQNLKVGNVYEIDVQSLPESSPQDLRKIRAVVASSKANHRITVKYPTISSLKELFGNEFLSVGKNSEQNNTSVATVADAVNDGNDNDGDEDMNTEKKENDFTAVNGSCNDLELDGSISFSFKEFTKLAIRKIPRFEYMHQSKALTFWIVESEDKFWSKESFNAFPDSCDDNSPVDFSVVKVDFSIADEKFKLDEDRMRKNEDRFDKTFDLPLRNDVKEEKKNEFINSSTRKSSTNLTIFDSSKLHTKESKTREKETGVGNFLKKDDGEDDENKVYSEDGTEEEKVEGDHRFNAHREDDGDDDSMDILHPSKSKKEVTNDCCTRRQKSQSKFELEFDLNEPEVTCMEPLPTMTRVDSYKSICKNSTHHNHYNDDSCKNASTKWPVKRRRGSFLVKPNSNSNLNLYSNSDVYNSANDASPDSCKGIDRLPSSTPSGNGSEFNAMKGREMSGNVLKSRKKRMGMKQEKEEEEENEESFDDGDKKEKGTIEKKNKKESNTLKLPKDMRGRWSSERYRAAQLKLVEIMKVKGACPGQPILRPFLREEARKHIGDTGLLDHLLKHMTDTVVGSGERFRRRHNNEGAMEYWLEASNLMALRQSAGITDPSWVPPPGWKPGKNPNPSTCCYCNSNSKLFCATFMDKNAHELAKQENKELKELRKTVEKMKKEIEELKEAKGAKNSENEDLEGDNNISKEFFKYQKCTEEEMQALKSEIQNLSFTLHSHTSLFQSLQEQQLEASNSSGSKPSPFEIEIMESIQKLQQMVDENVTKLESRVKSIQVVNEFGFQALCSGLTMDKKKSLLNSLLPNPPSFSSPLHLLPPSDANLFVHSPNHSFNSGKKIWLSVMQDGSLTSCSVKRGMNDLFPPLPLSFPSSLTPAAAAELSFSSVQLEEMRRTDEGNPMEEAMEEEEGASRMDGMSKSEEKQTKKRAFESMDPGTSGMVSEEQQEKREGEEEEEAKGDGKNSAGYSNRNPKRSKLETGAKEVC